MGCKFWPKGKSKLGYGICYRNRKQWLVHRWVYTCAYGPIPANMVVMHLCDNPGCFKLDHLMLGTQSENILDMYVKGRHKDQRGESHPNHKLTSAGVREIRKLLDSGYRRDVVAKMFNVSKDAIVDVALRRTWSHVV